jgi:hypothetical protein
MNAGGRSASYSVPVEPVTALLYREAPAVTVPALYPWVWVCGVRLEVAFLVVSFTTLKLVTALPLATGTFTAVVSHQRGRKVGHADRCPGRRAGGSGQADSSNKWCAFIGSPRTRRWVDTPDRGRHSP